MKITKLKLQNFRNYDKLEIKFNNNLNIIIGNNGAGKSNLIEAIYLLSLTKSFRTNNEENIIKNNCEFTNVSGSILTKYQTEYEIKISKNQKLVFIDNEKIKKISDYVSRINIILFNPLDTKIINDNPAIRRKMLNIEISSINKEYLILLNTYNKILKNRNAYLKQLYLNSNASKEYLNILTTKLIDTGYKIYEERKKYIDLINNYISKIYLNIFEQGNLKIKYNSRFNNKTKEEIYEEYKKNYRKEMEFGKTIFGIHHDDIDFILDGHSLKEYGSVGQQKNSIISFKLSEILIIKDIKNDYPILILDDLFSELDNQKINNIISMLNKEVQTFITTTDIEKVNEELLKESSIYLIKNSIVERIDKNEK